MSIIVIIVVIIVFIISIRTCYIISLLLLFQFLIKYLILIISRQKILAANYKCIQQIQRQMADLFYHNN